MWNCVKINLDYLCFKLHLCSGCYRRKAIWYYAAGKNEFFPSCDECVPRGCDCNREPVDGNPDNDDEDNWKEVLDDQGRKYPCCEWFCY